jgi:hypothetical protein
MKRVKSDFHAGRTYVFCELVVVEDELNGTRLKVEMVNDDVERCVSLLDLHDAT